MKAKRVSGKYVVTGLVGFTVLFGLVFWWFQTHAFYTETQAREHTVVIAGQIYPVTEWKSIEASSSPLKMRACFLIRETVEALPAMAPEPLMAPGWFRCFNARVIAENLASGYAKAYVALRNDPKGFDRIVAVFPGGRAYMWRQLNAVIAE
ncbi:MAG: DUF6446 family protein [Alphaproteobacteria bacterium]